MALSINTACVRAALCRRLASTAAPRASTPTIITSRRGPTSAAQQLAAQAAVRAWHLRDVVAFENLRPRVYQSVTALGTSWFAWNVWNGYSIVNTPELAEAIGLAVPLISMAAAASMIAASHFFSNYSVCRITLLQGGTHVRLTRHTLFGGERNRDVPLNLIHLHSSADEKQSSYRFTIDGETSRLYLIFDRTVPFSDREALCKVFNNPYLSEYNK